MKVTEIRAWMEKIGGGPNKRLGQHFLIDQAALHAVVEGGDVQQDDIVLEIGPGLGVLTGALLERGAKVMCLERDGRFLEVLRTRFASELASGQLTLHEGDAATMDWSTILPCDTAWKLISNLPYSISSLALRRALWDIPHATRVSVLVQLEVAQRAIARGSKPNQPTKHSLLSVMVGLATNDARIVRRVPPGAFYPPPQVDSAVLALSVAAPAERRERFGAEPQSIMSLAKVGFSHPRKYLLSNLGRGTALEEIFAEIELSPQIRAEDVSLEMWSRLARKYSPAEPCKTSE